MIERQEVRADYWPLWTVNVQEVPQDHPRPNTQKIKSSERILNTWVVLPTVWGGIIGQNQFGYLGHIIFSFIFTVAKIVTHKKNGLKRFSSLLLKGSRGLKKKWKWSKLWTGLEERQFQSHCISTSNGDMISSHDASFSLKFSSGRKLLTRRIQGPTDKPQSRCASGVWVQEPRHLLKPQKKRHFLVYHHTNATFPRRFFKNISTLTLWSVDLLKES